MHEAPCDAEGSEAGGAFMTQQSDAGTSRRRSVDGGTQLASAKITRVEEERLEWLLAQDVANVVPQLPARVDFQLVVCAVSDNLHFKSLSSRTRWRKRFSLPESKEFMRYAFWWVFLDRVATLRNSSGEAEGGEGGLEVASGFRGVVDARAIMRGKKALFHALAHSFFALFVALPPRRKDAYMGLLPDAMAQAVCLCFSSSYPSSKLLFDERFKGDVLRTMGHWVNGVMADKEPDLSHWGGENDKKGRGSLRRIMLNLDGPEGKGQNLPSLAGRSPHVNGAKRGTGGGGGGGGGGTKPGAGRDGGPANLVNIKTSTVYAPLEIAHSPLIDHVLYGDSTAACRSKERLSFRMTQSTRVYQQLPPDYYAQAVLPKSKPLLVTNGGAAGKRGEAEGKESEALVLRDETDKLELRDEEGKDENDDDEDEDMLDMYFQETYRDVVERAESTRSRLQDEHKQRRSALEKELKAVQRSAKHQQQQLEESKRRAMKGDIHELSNYLVSMWKVDDE